MCGIVGVCHFGTEQPIQANLVSSMCSTVRHRGPDEGGVYIDERRRVGLGHRRLSIIDLSSGQQPMQDVDKRACIVFNGEIYNYRELRADLEKQGFRFRTSSDTEVILQLYNAGGESSFSKLNGIFAFALYDRNRRVLILARDHFGVKPLYYANLGGRLFFGSEIKALLECPLVGRDLDFSALDSLLTFRYNPSPQTLFKNIRKLAPGHILTAQVDGNTEIRPFWESRPRTLAHISEEDAIEEYCRLLRQAVMRQMVSDVPVGILLSGGIDSAVIGYHMREQTQEKIKSFTIGFPGEGIYNELADARETASFLNLDHHEITISADDYMSFFPKSFYYTEEPIAEPTIPALYYVSKMASKHVKVVLAGQGADEPLAGYDRYVGEKYLSRWSCILRCLPLELVATFLHRNERFKRAAFASRFSDECQRFLAIYTIFTPKMKMGLLTDETRREIVSEDGALLDRIYPQTEGLSDTLSKILFMDTRLSLPDDLLLFGDKMTMANSLEMRVPFLDLDLVTFLESLPSQLKLRGRTGKYLHKKAIARWLPQGIIGRKKRGFSTPIDRWLQGGLASGIRTLINKPDSACRAYFNVPFICEMLADHQSRRENYQRHLFLLISFELWHRCFFQRAGVPEELLRMSTAEHKGTGRAAHALPD